MADVTAIMASLVNKSGCGYILVTYFLILHLINVNVWYSVDKQASLINIVSLHTPLLLYSLLVLRIPLEGLAGSNSICWSDHLNFIAFINFNTIFSLPMLSVALHYANSWQFLDVVIGLIMGDLSFDNHIHNVLYYSISLTPCCIAYTILL